MTTEAAVLTLTPAEADHVEWAFGAMSDYWGAPCEPGRAPEPEAEGVTENELEVPEGALMPFLAWGAAAGSARTLTLSTWDEVNDDLAQRIGDQLPDMADNAVGNIDMSRQRATAIARSAGLLAKRIRGAMGAAGE